MTAQALGVSYTDLRLETQYAAGWKAPGSWNAHQSDQFARILKKSLVQVYNAPLLPGERTRHDWSFLYPYAQVLLSEPFSTGTLAFGGSTISFDAEADDDLPSWHTQGELVFESDAGVLHRLPLTNATDVGGGQYTITLPTGLSSGDIAASAGTTFTIYRYYYNLPDDFGSVDADGFAFVQSRGCEPTRLVRVSDNDLRWSQSRFATGTPWAYSLVTKVPTAADSGHWRVGFGDDVASAARVIHYRYRAIPPLLNGSTHIYPYGSDKYPELFIASIIDVTHQQIHGNYDRHQGFLEALASAVMEDRQHAAPHNLGLSRSGSEDYADLDSVLRDWHSQTPSSMTLPI